MRVVSADTLLGKLSPYMGNDRMLVKKQTVPDIMAWINKCHKLFALEYDKIYPYFFTTCDPYVIGKSIFSFLRKNSFYDQETEDYQTVRSLASIVATGDTLGLDCKNFALFAGGIIDAINRNTDCKIPFVYRFASDRFFNSTPNHVFVVLNPQKEEKDQDKEIWIDPIPQVSYFDEHLYYTKTIDEKISVPMSLHMLSGVSSINGGAFGIGEDKLRKQMTDFITRYPYSFLYLFLPTGQPNQGQDHGMNTAPAVPGLPSVVLDKKQKAFETVWNWGMPTGLDTVTQIWPMIRNAVSSSIGMSPEKYWSKALSVVIATPAVGGATDYTQVANVILPGSGTSIELAKGLLSSFVPDLTWTYQPDSFTPEVSDWAGSKWKDVFIQNADPSSGGSLIPSKKEPATMSVPLLLLLGGSVFYFANKK